MRYPDDEKVLNDIADELKRARDGHSPLHSAHEGIAVIEEEYIELREEVYKKRENRDLDKMRKEAIQIAAMAVRFIVDLNLA